MLTYENATEAERASFIARRFKLAKHIRELPEEKFDIKRFTMGDGSMLTPRPRDPEQCGTPACIAGHAIACFGEAATPLAWNDAKQYDEFKTLECPLLAYASRRHDIVERAQAILGLTEHQADMLFLPDTPIADFIGTDDAALALEYLANYPEASDDPKAVHYLTESELYPDAHTKEVEAYESEPDDDDDYH